MAASADTASFTAIPTAARRYVSTTGRSNYRPGGALAYACTHCSDTRHTDTQCWKLHPELRPKRRETRERDDAKPSADEEKEKEKTAEKAAVAAKKGKRAPKTKKERS